MTAKPYCSLGPRSALLRRGGFEIACTDFRFIFARALWALRPIGDVVYRLPLGAQDQVLGRAGTVTGEP